MKETEKELFLQKENYHFEDLITVVKILRGEGGCPWDREQTHASIRNGLIEETYEVIEAIDTENPVLLREELGDVLLQVVFHAQIETEQGRFTVDDVADGICRKMIHRHPHVFGNVTADTSEQVLANWEKIKTAEKHRDTLCERLRAVPPMLPALLRAAKVAKKAGETERASADELTETLHKSLTDLQSSEREALSDRIGDILLKLTVLSSCFGVDAEKALGAATDRLIDKIAASEAGKE